VALRPIVLYPDPALLQPTRPVKEVDDEVRALVRDMVETLYAAPGIGLAANQIGVQLRVCIVDLSAGDRAGQLTVLINPEVKETAGSDVGEEGCLSFPQITLDIERPWQVTVEHLDLDGNRRTTSADGLLARAMLHEIEHLDGHTFLRNVSTARRELVKRRIRKLMKAGDWISAVAP
jgi:peptide deformylase